jgi:hypothetical protein
MASVRAAVLVKPKTLEAREFARPAIVPGAPRVTFPR